MLKQILYATVRDRKESDVEKGKMFTLHLIRDYANLLVSQNASVLSNMSRTLTEYGKNIFIHVIGIQ